MLTGEETYKRCNWPKVIVNNPRYHGEGKLKKYFQAAREARTIEELLAISHPIMAVVLIPNGNEWMYAADTIKELE